MHVFILDDQPGLAQVLALGLKMEGFSASAFSCPHKALKAIGKGDVDVLVTDYHMPEMTGLEVVRRAYAQGWKGVPCSSSRATPTPCSEGSNLLLSGRF
jgi:DNA-binding response OmpR family regulator